MAGFTKLHATILDSSVWSQPHHVRIVWITMLAMADANGVVAASIDGLARRAVVTIDEAEDALRVFLGPDRYSRDGTTGERIEVIPGGWFILNHRAHRDRQTDQQAEVAARVRRHRERKKLAANAVTPCNDVTPCNALSLSEAEAEAEAEAEEEEKTENPPTPRRGKRTRPKAAEPPPIPEVLSTPQFVLAWDRWCKRCSELGARHKQTTSIMEAQLLKLEAMGHDRAITALNHSTGTHWQGIFEPDERTNPTANGKPAYTPPKVTITDKEIDDWYGKS